MSTIRWCLQSGVNDSHLHQYDWFERKRDAMAAADRLPLAPDGLKRPYQIWRHEYESLPGGWQRDVSRRVVVGQLRRTGV